MHRLGTGGASRGAWAGLLVAAGLYTLGMCVYVAWRAERSTDFRDFWETGRHFRQTGQLTDALGVHNYLPFFGLFMAPWSLLPLRPAIVLFTLLSAGLLAVTAWMCETLLTGGAGRRPRAAMLATIGLMLPFAHATLTVGAVNILVLFLIVAAWLLVERGREWHAGAALGLAVLIKLMPAALLAYFVLRLRWRVVVSAALVALILGLGLPLISLGPAETVRAHRSFYAQALVEHSASRTIRADKPRKAKFSNQSVPIVLRRLLSPVDANAGEPADAFYVNVANVAARGRWAAYLGLMAMVLVGSVAAALVPPRDWPPRDTRQLARLRAGFAAWCCVALLASPLVWTHYFVLAYWPVALLADVACAAERRGRTARFSSAALLVWLLGALLLAVPQARAAGAQMLAVLVAWGVLVWLTGAAGRRESAQG